MAVAYYIITNFVVLLCQYSLFIIQTMANNPYIHLCALLYNNVGSM